MAQPSVAPELVLETETGTTVMIPGRDYHVGRDPSCEIVIDDDRVSWHHAVLKPEDGHWTLEDEDSTNGTYADGRRIHEWDVGPGSVIRFGEFTTIDLGDLLIPQELDLVCPANRLGTVDLYITSHHGLNTSGSAALVHALHPRVAIMNNGTRKGGAVEIFQTLHSSPGLEDVWQLHWSYAGGVEHNSPGVFIANLDEPAVLAAVISPPPAPAAAPQGGGACGGGAQAAARPGQHNTGPAYAIRVSARADGSFTVTNTRNGFSKTYE